LSKPTAGWGEGKISLTSRQNMEGNGKSRNLTSIREGLQDELSEYGIENVSIQPGVFPTEMNNGTKAGVQSDKNEVTAAYGEAAPNKFNTIGTALFGKMSQFDMNPQQIADGILNLISGRRKL
jgi:NAD(P)-dependent dehydrogenase (short-subunit alcohol dehydrogenase family)